MTKQDEEEMRELREFHLAMKNAKNLMGDRTFFLLSVAMIELATLMDRGLSFSDLNEEAREFLSSSSRLLGQGTYGVLWRAHRNRDRIDALVEKHVARVEISMAAENASGSSDPKFYN